MDDLPTIAPIIDTSPSVPPMDNMHDNTTSVVPTQEAAAHVPPLPTAETRK